MAYWRFVEYVTEEEPRRCPIIEWYGTLDPEVQAEFDIQVKALSEIDNWDDARPKYKELDRQHAGLCELRLKVGKRHFRPIGVLLREERTFVFLGGCEKKGRGTTDPEQAFEIAMNLKRQLEAGKGALREYAF
ncbi:MAG TPA: type II toxin-antitoxin system RelE/ParE family toxin [Candidatus Acidoferrales bacterium]